MPETYSIREAAELCHVSYEAMRARVDRGLLQVVRRGGKRRIPRSELERTGLWPASGEGAGDVDSLRAENAELREQLRELRLIPERIEREWRGRLTAEHDARERAEAAAREAATRRAEAQLRVEQAEATMRATLAAEREAQRAIGRLEERLRRRSLTVVRRRLREAGRGLGRLISH